MREAIVKLGNGRERGSHPGLILQRYLTDPSAQDSSDQKQRRALFDAACKAASSESLSSIYAEAFARWSRSFPQDNPHRTERLVTAGRLIVGLGSENVLETGLRLHHTYGVPIIPGSALKGLASHYCHEVWGQRHDATASEENRLFQRGGERSHHSLLFGATDDGGVITFHDAWIVPESLSGALRLDVMTPHHPKWQTGEAPPTDFDSPNPISFLSVTGTFDIRLSWSGPVAAPSDRAEAWTALAMKLLREALAKWGVGGKTSSGYGRLLPVESTWSSPQPQSMATFKPVALPKPNEVVEAQLLEERTSKGGWKALHAPSKLSGSIQNSGAVPAERKAGETLKLIVAFANEREIAFRYPTPADEARAQRTPSGRGGSGKSGRKK
jgi:CRISPR-associated protein Cmr6